MDVKLYTGTGATQNITGLAFSPDLVWAKVRNTTGNHSLYDIVRGALQRLSSSTTSAEATFTSSLTSFDSGGFSLGSNSDGDVNASGNTYVAWAWDAGTTTTTNTVGSISSQVRANASAGFSIVTFTGNATAGATVGHGLGVAPEFLITKSRSATGSWLVYHKSVGNTKYLALNLTIAEQTSSDAWNNTTPSSTVFTLGGAGIQPSGVTQVVYCFAPVAGYSSFGSYTGNGSADGPFIYTGFRPKFFMHKDYTAGGADRNWLIWDAAREPYNTEGRILFANLSNGEATNSGHAIDFVSNGIKIRNNNININPNGVGFIYMAFAESPFQFSRAR
jgi:hypothetical protein